MRDHIIPWAVGDTPLGDDVLEVGPGYGPTTEALSECVPKLTAVEIDPELASALATRLAGSNVDVIEGDATALTFPDGRFTAAMCFNMLHHVGEPALQDRLFAEVARVMRPGAPFIASDSLDNEGLRAFHEDDTFVPVPPDELPARLEAAGFTDVDVRTNEYAWSVRAVRRAG